MDTRSLMTVTIAASMALSAAVLLSPAAGAAGHGKAADNARSQSGALAEIRRATQRFRDVNVALNAGYVPTPDCVTATFEGEPRQLGAMGIHYVRPDLLGLTAPKPGSTRVNGVGTHTDFREPGVLVYEPQADGSLALVAVENLVFAEAWAAQANTEPPAFEGNQYYYMIDNPLTEHDEAHGFEPHYELHIWLYRENPAGVFMPFNTRVSCPGGQPQA